MVCAVGVVQPACAQTIKSALTSAPLIQPGEVKPSKAPVASPRIVESNRAVSTTAETEVSQISGHTVACQAACCWPLARLLEQRAQTLASEADGKHHAAEIARLKADFLRRQAAWQRDLAAAMALRAYYSWIANQEALRIVGDALQLTEEQQQVQAALVAQGVGIPDPTMLDRKRLELRDQQLQLLANDQQLANQLLRLTCCASDLRSSAVEGLDIVPQELDCNRWVQFALAHRQDYCALAVLCRSVDPRNARDIAELITPLVNVGLDGLDVGLAGRLLVVCNSSEVASGVRRELQLALQLLRQRLEQSVCDKCQALSLAYQRLMIAEQVVQSWQERISALERLGQLGDARGEQLAAARGEWLTARSTLVTRKLSARLAEVDLSEAVGGLAGRCCQGLPWLPASELLHHD